MPVIVLFGILLLLAIGLTVATNWRGAAKRYATVVDAFVPSGRPWKRRSQSPDEEFASFVLQQRVIFGLVAALAAGCFIALIIGTAFLR